MRNSRAACARATTKRFARNASFSLSVEKDACVRPSERRDDRSEEHAETVDRTLSRLDRAIGIDVRFPIARARTIYLIGREVGRAINIGGKAKRLDFLSRKYATASA